MAFTNFGTGITGIEAVVISSIAAVVWRNLRNRWRQHSSADWPTTSATILSGDVQTSEESLAALATVTYSYFVGEYRAGQFKRYLDSEASAADFIRMVKGRTVEVRYHREHPDRSVLVQESLTKAEQAGMLQEAGGPR